jgi:MATE family multidrug resistance protein
MGAVSLGSALFIVLALFGEGLLLGLDTLVSQAFGAGRREDCHRSLINGVYLSIALTPFSPRPFFFWRTFFAPATSTPPWPPKPFPTPTRSPGAFSRCCLYFAVRRCLQAMNMVRPVAFALVTANIVNAVFNWLLIYGKLGFPAMGTVGSGWSYRHSSCVHGRRPHRLSVLV